MIKAVCSKIILDSTDTPIAKEYMNCINDLIINHKVKELNKFSQHRNTCRLQHSINVSYYSYRIAKLFKLDYKKAARAGLLHDFFLYDWKKTQTPKHHILYHPKIAHKNALSVTNLSQIEEDAILNHMWPLSQNRPKYKESYTVTVADKYCTILELYTQFKVSIIKTITNIKSIIKFKVKKARG